jgi:hypothetical protein
VIGMAAAQVAAAIAGKISGRFGQLFPLTASDQPGRAFDMAPDQAMIAGLAAPFKSGNLQMF